MNSVDPRPGGPFAETVDSEGVFQRVIRVDEFLFPVGFRDDPTKFPPVRGREGLIGEMGVLSSELAHTFDDGIGVLL
ncbi:hypothetical protein [Halorubrum sp. F4]|uniref:hypothetical protein n=1 Tax=Halorubrum sp. F4 TaxID=2989715 RepID=UPI0024813E6C|nr:hypothetical protein [Halorubrum sp. F4]